MKKVFAMLVVVMVCASGRAQTAEYLQQKDFRVEKQKIYDGIGVIKKQVAEMKKGDLKLQHSLDSLQQVNTILSLQLEVMADSVGKTKSELQALREKADNLKILSRGARILISGMLFILVIVLLIILYRVYAKADRTQKAMAALDKEIREQVAHETTHSREAIQNCKALVINTSNEIDQRITNGLATMEHNNRQLQNHLNESLAAIDGRVELAGEQVQKMAASYGENMKTLEVKLNAIIRESGDQFHALESQVTRLAGEMKAGKGKIVQ